jgi:hypothetical protein
MTAMLLLHLSALNQKPDPPFNTANGTLPAVFKLSNRKTDPDSAEAYCNDVGGHQSQYTSQEEQADVEKFYTKSQPGHPKPGCPAF